MLKKKFYICYSGNKCSEKNIWGKKKHCPLKLASDTDFLNFTACLHRQKTVRSGTSYLPESI